jgi:hypothetical protein
LNSLLPGALERYAEQELRDWAAYAVFRNIPGLCTGSRDELVESVTTYAHRLLDLLVDEANRHTIVADEAGQCAA